jgi:hypothetical protein
MKGSGLRILIIIVIVLLSMSVGWAQAQVGDTGEDGQPQRANEVAAILEDAIPIQGRLTDSTGAPLTGDHSVTFSIYDAAVAGILLCSTNYNPLAMTNGLFNATVNGCTDNEISGNQLYLGVQVDADAEMTPRQPIYAVPYARSLRPGADIGGEVSGLSTLALYNTSTTNNSKGLYSIAEGNSGITFGVYGRAWSPDGYGGYFDNTGAAGVGLFARAGDDNGADLVLGGNNTTDDNGRIDSDPDLPSSDLLLVSNDRFHIHLDNNNDEDNSDFSILNSANTTVLTAEENGRLNLGINAGAATAITVGDRYRDNSIVAWAKVTATGTISSEFGVASVTKDPGSGSYLIALDASSAGAAYLLPIAIAEIDTQPNSAAGLRIISINQIAASTFQVFINNGSGTPVDNDFVFMVTAR